MVKKERNIIQFEDIMYKLLYLFIFLLLFNACSKEETSNPVNAGNINSCVGCHTNYDALKKLADPDTSAPAGGCSGEGVHIEPYDRVYLGGQGFEDFQKEAHGKMACTACHNGIDKTGDKKLAHSGNFIKHPSKFATEKCVTCHEDEVRRTHNSIHEMGWGQKRKVTMRYGLAGPHEFNKLPENVQKGYNANCATCHGSCGECHVSKPLAAGGGLMNGHKFSKKPDMVKVCVACHSSRGGHAYLGVAVGSKPDVHLTKLGFDCMSCHTKNEIHGDGNTYEQRYKVPDMPKCEDCHSNIKNSNSYHSMHAENLSCFVCHSQPYNNCGSCHIHGEGARIASYQGFKIGVNPLSEFKGTRLALVRRTLMAPDSWKEYGVTKLNNFDVFPVFNYTSPHNILRKTKQCSPDEGKACYYNCHIIKEGEIFRNKELYLFESDFIYDWEKSSSKKVTVDGKLPPNWGL
ncbi:hypothetical protein D9V86_10540 [Bacteroidetes/Chlorobi group bacterium ChocPot_Mid]|nr:MAG: hypothetical protein D9V86_10540 [Bacteroidetes/Chlorobi group bacterium ChocPot_Mid]